MKVLRSRILAVAAGAAVVVGLGAGGATAAGLIGSPDIRNQSVRGVDIARSAVDTTELRNRGVRGPDIGWDTIGRPQLRPDSVGRNQLSPWVLDHLHQQATDGTDGADGVDGTDGKDGVSGYEVVGRGTDAATLTAGETATLTSLCASDNQATNDKVASSGGAKATSGSITLNGSYPDAIERVGDNTEQDPAGLWAAKGWTVQVTAGPDGATVQPFIICQDNAEDD